MTPWFVTTAYADFSLATEHVSVAVKQTNTSTQVAVETKIGGHDADKRFSQCILSQPFASNHIARTFCSIFVLCEG